jgi:hypothetical protein
MFTCIWFLWIVWWHCHVISNVTAQWCEKDVELSGHGLILKTTFAQKDWGKPWKVRQKSQSLRWDSTWTNPEYEPEELLQSNSQFQKARWYQGTQVKHKTEDISHTRPWLLTAQSSVQSQVSPCGFVVQKVATQLFLSALQLPLASYSTTAAHWFIARPQYDTLQSRQTSTASVV